jgi:hypothetical protein
MTRVKKRKLFISFSNLESKIKSIYQATMSSSPNSEEDNSNNITKDILPNNIAGSRT